MVKMITSLNVPLNLLKPVEKDKKLNRIRIVIVKKTPPFSKFCPKRGGGFLRIRMAQNLDLRFRPNLTKN